MSEMSEVTVMGLLHVFSHRETLYAIYDERASVIHARRLVLRDEHGNRFDLGGVLDLVAIRAGIDELNKASTCFGRATPPTFTVQLPVRKAHPPQEKLTALELRVIGILESYGMAQASSRTARCARDVVNAVLAPFAPTAEERARTDISRGSTDATLPTPTKTGSPELEPVGVGAGPQLPNELPEHTCGDGLGYMTHGDIDCARCRIFVGEELPEDRR